MVLTLLLHTRWSWSTKLHNTRSKQQKRQTGTPQRCTAAVTSKFHCYTSRITMHSWRAPKKCPSSARFIYLGPLSAVFPSTTAGPVTSRIVIFKYIEASRNEFLQAEEKTGKTEEYAKEKLTKDTAACKRQNTTKVVSPPLCSAG